MYQNKILILCEGDTEKNAVEIFLRKSLEHDNVRVGLKALSKGYNFEKIKAYADDAIEGNAKAVFSLFDIYGFPGLQPSDDVHKKIIEGKKFLINKMGIGASKYFPHFTVHETESWFFADDALLCRFLRTNQKLAHLKPEEIDFQDHPSRRLSNLSQKYRKQRYDKNYDSSQMFKHLEFDAVYRSCPYFKQFWDELVTVARSNASI